MRASTEITLIVAGFFVLLALIALVRTLVSKARAPRKVRVGVFIERSNGEDDD